MGRHISHKQENRVWTPKPQQKSLGITQRVPGIRSKVAWCLLLAGILLTIADCIGPPMTSSEQSPPIESEAPVLSPLEQEIQDRLQTMTLEEKAAQLFISTPEALVPQEQGVTAGEKTRQVLQTYPIGGWIYMGKNLQNEAQTKQMIAQFQTYSMERLDLPAFVCVDEEGGSVSRINGSKGFAVPKVGAMSDVGAAGDRDYAREIGKTIGRYLSELGFNVDFAPVADVLNTPDNPLLRGRCFGNEPKSVGPMALAVAQGLESQGVYSTFKHFPGHGAVAGDTHEGQAITEKTLEELKTWDLIPFQMAIESGCSFIMVSHISLPNVTGDTLPASLSPIMIQKILREQMGYEGLVITDALDMEAIRQTCEPGKAAVLALNAGADLLLTVSDFYSAYQGVLEALKTGELTQERLDQSVSRILEVKLTMNPSLS